MLFTHCKGCIHIRRRAVDTVALILFVLTRMERYCSSYLVPAFLKNVAVLSGLDCGVNVVAVQRKSVSLGLACLNGLGPVVKHQVLGLYIAADIVASVTTVVRLLKTHANDGQI